MINFEALLGDFVQKPETLDGEDLHVRVFFQPPGTACLLDKVSFHSNILLGIKQALLTRWQATSKQFIANLNVFLFHPKEKYNNFTNSGKMTPVENDCSIQFWFFLHTTSTLNQTMQAITYTYQHTQDVWIPLWFTSVVFLTSEKLFHVEKSHFC